MSKIITTKFVISPPFGNWIAAPHCTRILGSFTWEQRPGLCRQVLRTLRPVSGGWVNQIGLRNCGIRNVKFDDRFIYSLVGLEEHDWEKMYDHCPAGLRVEVNLGCPNVHDYGICLDTLRAYCQKFRIITKLSPYATPSQIEAYIEAGVTHLHLCNTLPSPRGGISGQQLQPLSLSLIRMVAHRFPQVTIIGGGGISGSVDCAIYELAGADHLSLATCWFTPWRIPAILLS